MPKGKGNLKNGKGGPKVCAKAGKFAGAKSPRKANKSVDNLRCSSRSKRPLEGIEISEQSKAKCCKTSENPKSKGKTAKVKEPTNSIGINNNATVSTQQEKDIMLVVGSTKNLIHSIRKAKQTNDQANVSNVSLSKAPVIDIPAILAKPPLPNLVINGEHDNMEDTIPGGDGIEVEVDPQDDEYQDEGEILHQGTQSLHEDFSDVESEDSMDENETSQSESSSPGEADSSDSNTGHYRKCHTCPKGHKQKLNNSGGGSHHKQCGININKRDEAILNDPCMVELMRQICAEKQSGEGNEMPKQHQKGNVREKLMGKHKLLMVKSPSDTTIYAPALAKGSIIPKQVLNPVANIDPIQQISQFVESIHMENSRNSEHHGDRPSTSNDDGKNIKRHEHDRHRDRSLERRSEAQKVIVEVEQFKASISQPSGKVANAALVQNNCELEVQQFNQAGNLANTGEQYMNVDIAQFMKLLNNCQDDEFFHLTCHVEVGLQSKIE